MMRDFSIVSSEGEDLLSRVDGSKLSAFLGKFQKFVHKSDRYPSIRDWKRFFNAELGKNPQEMPDSEVKRAMKNFLLWYQEVMDTRYTGVESVFTPIQKAAGVPESDYEFSYALPEVCMRILMQHPALLEGLLSDDLTKEVRGRVARTILVQNVHPLGFVPDKTEFRWRSPNGYFYTMQDMHGDLHIGRYGFAERELFDDPTIVKVSAENRQGINIWQYPTSYLGALCHYVLLTGQIPRELADWKAMREGSKTIIPFATEAYDRSWSSPRHLALMHSWGYNPTVRDSSGEYLYMGNQIGADTLVCINRKNHLVFLRGIEGRLNNGITFGGFEKKVSFIPVLEFGPEDIGPAIQALFHLPGRSTNDLNGILEAFDLYRGGEIDLAKDEL